MEAPGVVPGVSYSGEVARGVLPIDGIVVSVGDFDDEALVDFCGAMTGIETSFSRRDLERVPTTMMSSPEESSTSELLGTECLVRGVRATLEILRFLTVEEDLLLLWESLIETEKSQLRCSDER